MLKTRRQAVENSKLDLEKAKVSSVGEINSKEAQVRRVEGQIQNWTRQVSDFTDQLSKCEITAPVDGLVMYGDPNQHMYYNQQIKVGAEWYGGGNVLMTIPDLSAFEIDFMVAETYRGRLAVGNKTMMTLDAIPGLTLEGEITKIGELGRPRDQWNAGSPKAFPGTIRPIASDPRMISGMSVQIEIVTDVLENVIMVPIEAVVNDDGTTVCFVRENGRSVRREVVCGKSSDHFVEVTSGLNEGEEVDLHPVVQTELAAQS
jgi:multidrug efflux pump subunit AcrA (membrane-fusion protein)